MSTNYGITASTSADALRSLVNTAYSEVYILAATAGSTAATTISNLLTLPETVSNWPLYAYMMVPKVERLLFIDLERTEALEGTHVRSRRAGRQERPLRLAVGHREQYRRLPAKHPDPAAKLQVACQALSSQLDSESLRRVTKSVYDVLVLFAMDVDKDQPADVARPFEVSMRTAHAVANGLDPPMATIAMFATAQVSSNPRSLIPEPAA